MFKDLNSCNKHAPDIGFKEVPKVGGGRAKWNGLPMRPPKKGELYLTAGQGIAYLAYEDLVAPYFIAVPVEKGSQHEQGSQQAPDLDGILPSREEGVDDALQ